ncbi:MAG: DNA repair protein RecO [Alistipes sp.]|nr:DNA repair protein RecO [Candidatus Alistipes equi]
MERYKTRGIVLLSTKYGERDLIVQLLTEKFGIKSYLVRGARSTRGHGSKLALFQPMFCLEFDGISTTRSELDYISEVKNAFVLRTIPFDIRKSTIALFMSELIFKLVKEKEQNTELFCFIADAIQQFDCMQEGIANFHLWFVVHLLSIIGFHPGNGYSEGCQFDLQEGIYTSQPIFHDNFLCNEESQLLAYLIDSKIDELCKIKLVRGQRLAFLEKMIKFSTIHLENVGKINSLEILHDIF